MPTRRTARRRGRASCPANTRRATAYTLSAAASAAATLRADIVTLGEALKGAGYTTASMGKWHLGDGQTGPVGQGFDVNVGGNSAGHPRSYFSPYRNKDLTDGPKGEYLTDRLTAEALKFIEANRSRPFFLYLPHYAVHTPIQAKKAMTAKYRAKKPDRGQSNPAYAAMIESSDQGVGRILARLDELGLADNTIVVFFSDNGGHGGVTSMAPLRGAKGMLYEGGIREPLIVRWPGKVKAGSRCGTAVIGIDFYPTFLEIAGAAAPKGQVLDGESLVGLMTRGEPLKRKAIFWHFPAYLQASGAGKWRTTPAGAVQQGDWKLIEFFEDGRLELYNLKDDIGEKNNLAGKMPDKAKELHDLLKAWRKKVNAPVPTEPNPKYAPDSATSDDKPKKRGRKRGKRAASDS
jgi:arylsulfatase A-like enzyme